MNNKINLRALSLCLALLCTLPAINITHRESHAKLKDSNTITIEKGKIYKLRSGRGCTYKSSKPQIASVSKKAVIKARKKGKCIVKVIKGRKIIKYKVKVVNKINNKPVKKAAPLPDEKEKLQSTPNILEPHPILTPSPTCAPGGYIALGRGTIISIKKNDDSTYECVVELSENDIDNLKGKFKDCPNVQYVICKCTKNYEVNAGVSIIVNQNEYLSKYSVKEIGRAHV